MPAALGREVTRWLDTGAALALLWQNRRNPWLPRGELTALQEHRLRAVLAFAAERSPFYRKLYQGVDLRWTPLSDLPVVEKAELVAQFDEVTTDRSLRRREVEEFLRQAPPGDQWYRNRYLAVTTSGSSGERSLTVLGHHEVRWWVMQTLRAAAMQRRRPQRLARIVPVGSRHASFRVGMLGPSVRGKWARTFDILAPLPTLVDQLNAYQPEALACYPTLVGTLAEEQRAGRLRIRPRTVFSRGEVLTPAVRQQAADLWGARVLDGYGVSETGLMAAQCLHSDGMHVFEDTVILEPVDAALRPVLPGREAESVLVTSLFARTVPVIRFRLADRITLADGACPCGRTFVRLAAVGGKSEVHLYFRRQDGSWTDLHPILFDDVIEPYDRVKAYQVLVDDSGVTARLVPAEGVGDPAPDLAEKLAAMLARQGVVTPPLRVELRGELPREEALGKAPRYIGRVRPPA